LPSASETHVLAGYCGVWLIKCRQGSKTNKSKCRFWKKLTFDRLWTNLVRICWPTRLFTPVSLSLCNESQTSVNGQLWTMGGSLHAIGDNIDTKINDPLGRTLSVAIDELNNRTKKQMMPKLNTLSLWHDSTLFFIESIFQEIKKTGKISTPAKEFVRRALGFGVAEFVPTDSEDNSDDGEARGPSAKVNGKQKADDEESDRSVTILSIAIRITLIDLLRTSTNPRSLYEASTPLSPNPSNPNPSNHSDRPVSGAQSVQMVSRKRSLPPASTSTRQSQSRPCKSSRVKYGQGNIVPSAGIEPPS
jgi:hypothetical protein